MTDDDRLVTDGNAIAGLIEQLLGVDITAASRRCGSCGQSHAVGRHRLYRGAGIVLRCPSCSAVAIQVVELRDRVLVQFPTHAAAPAPRGSST